MDIMDYWQTVSRRVSGCLESLGLALLDICLVGSAASGCNRAVRDIDSVVLIDASIPLEVLKDIRRLLVEMVPELGEQSMYHFKLLTREEMRLLGMYDGFRMLEFQVQYFSLLESDIITTFRPLLSRKTFWNSIFIQMVYEFMMMEEHYSLAHPRIRARLAKRAARNRALARMSGREIPVSLDESIESLSRCDNLFRQFFRLGTYSMSHNEGLLRLLDLYFKRFRHEYINKYYVYRDVAIRRQNREDKDTYWRSRCARDS